MTTLDSPPADFAKLTLVTTEVAPAALLRIASAKHLLLDPFRRSAEYRFDSPDGSFGVLYAPLILRPLLWNPSYAQKHTRCRPVSRHSLTLQRSSPGVL